MCAYDRTPIGPELALLSQRTPLSLQDARIRGVLHDELDGASAEWTLAERDESHPITGGARTNRSPMWVRLFGRRHPRTEDSRAPSRLEERDGLGFAGPTPARPTGARR